MTSSCPNNSLKSQKSYLHTYYLNVKDVLSSRPQSKYNFVGRNTKNADKYQIKFSLPSATQENMWNLYCKAYYK